MRSISTRSSRGWRRSSSASVPSAASPTIRSTNRSVRAARIPSRTIGVIVDEQTAGQVLTILPVRSLTGPQWEPMVQGSRASGACAHSSPTWPAHAPPGRPLLKWVGLHDRRSAVGGAARFQLTRPSLFAPPPSVGRRPLGPRAKVNHLLGHERAWRVLWAAVGVGWQACCFTPAGFWIWSVDGVRGCGHWPSVRHSHLVRLGW